MMVAPLLTAQPAQRRRLPFLVAHRAGNSLARLREAEACGLRFVEADVRLFRDRAEVRHLKSLGPLPVFWDRWRLDRPGRPRLLLEDLLEAIGARTELVLDLKGPRRRLAEVVLSALDPYLHSRRFTVCSRSWRLLEPFEDLPVRRVHSVGSARQLRALLRRYHGGGLDGVSIHERLLDAQVAGELRRIAALVISWPVNDPERASALTQLGIDGLITDLLPGPAPA
jgi:glycerophosphoryl diester phosphodiesterase